jgi:putative endopeptidase
MSPIHFWYIVSTGVELGTRRSCDLEKAAIRGDLRLWEARPSSLHQTDVAEGSCEPRERLVANGWSMINSGPLRRSTTAFACAAVALTLALTAGSASPSRALLSGFDSSGMDIGIKPGADFFRYANGGWERRTRILDDQSSTGAISQLDTQSRTQVRAILERLSHDRGSRAGTGYLAFLEQDRIDGLGMAPVRPWLARMRAIATPQAYWAAAADAGRRGVPLPLTFEVDADDGHPDRYALIISQGGLGMPDRDYYLGDSVSMQQARAAYRSYLFTTLRAAGTPDAPSRADAILQLETRIAAVSWKAAASRDAQRTYNPVEIASLDAGRARYPVASLVRGLGYDTTRAVVRQPDAVAAILRLIEAEPVETLRDVMVVRMLHRYAEVLPEAVRQPDFAFYGRAINGVTEEQPRWRRAVDYVLGSVPDEVSRIYVANHFSPATKAAAEKMVQDLVAAFGHRIDTLDWMTPETKAHARRKLAAFRADIGYPDRWHDYRRLIQRAGDAFGNAVRAAAFQHNWESGKPGHRVYRWEWSAPPMTVDAFANYPRVAIVFPAAILQPPFFNPRADAAVNYGGIGASIAHEMTHHFDDQGSRYNEHGQLTPWWAAADRRAFEQRTAVLAGQFDNYEPLPGMHVNGTLTLGENIADLGGLTIAYDAYRTSLGGKAAPVIDGLTGGQRFFLGWAQIWRLKYRDADLKRRLLTNPHAPAAQRVWTVRNLDAWVRAFHVDPSDELYLPVSRRAQIW